MNFNQDLMAIKITFSGCFMPLTYPKYSFTAMNFELMATKIVVIRVEHVTAIIQ